MCRKADAVKTEIFLAQETAIPIGQSVVDFPIDSNKESGLSGYDIVIIPKNPKKLGIILEIKIANEKTHTFSKLSLKRF